MDSTKIVTKFIKVIERKIKALENKRFRCLLSRRADLVKMDKLSICGFWAVSGQNIKIVGITFGAYNENRKTLKLFWGSFKMFSNFTEKIVI